MSGHLIKYGSWEGDLLHNFKTLMRQYPNMVLLDVGTNIGSFSLFAAALGHYVISVEPAEVNLDLLRKSVLLNGFQDRIVIVENAVSGKRSKLTYNEPNKNLGGIRMQDYEGKGRIVNSIKLSDLRDLFLEGSTVFMKMDIEGYEDYAMAGAGGLFEKIFVPYIMMEWAIQKKRRKKPESLIAMMLNYGYFAVSHSNGSYLNMNNTDLQNDIIWVHKQAKLPKGLHKGLN